MTIIPDQFCRSFETAPHHPRATTKSHTFAANNFPFVGIMRPKNAILKCFTCLTSILDILITNSNVFSTLSAPRKADCFLECGGLGAGTSQQLDVSSIRAISSDSIRARFNLMKVEDSHSSAGNYGYYGTGSQNSFKDQAAQKWRSRAGCKRKQFSFSEYA